MTVSGRAFWVSSRDMIVTRENRYFPDLNVRVNFSIRRDSWRNRDTSDPI